MINTYGKQVSDCSIFVFLVAKIVFLQHVWRYAFFWCYHERQGDLALCHISQEIIARSKSLRDSKVQSIASLEASIQTYTDEKDILQVLIDEEYSELEREIKSHEASIESRETTLHDIFLQCMEDVHILLSSLSRTSWLHCSRVIHEIFY